MTRSVPRGRGQHQASVAKDIVFAVDEFHRMAPIKAHAVLPAPGPLVLYSLSQSQRFGKRLDIPGMVRVAMRHGPQLNSRGTDLYLRKLCCGRN